MDTLAILSTLLRSAHESNLSAEEIAALEKAFLAAASTNATAKWVLDRAIMEMK